MAPPRHTPTFADIPAELGTLFRRAFERGSEAGTRPRPAEWLAALQRLEQSIVKCGADPGHKYWRGAQSCVWCRLAEHGGPEYYFGVAGGVSTFAVDEEKLQDALRRLNACGPFDFSYDRRRFTPPRVPKPEPLQNRLKEHRNSAIILGVATGLCLLVVPFGLIYWAIGVVGFLGALFFGSCLAIHTSQSPWHREYRRRRTARNRARNDRDEIEAKWRQTVGRYCRAHSESSRSLQRLISDCRGLAPQYQVELRRLAANAEAIARLRHLRLHSIADADIPKIGAGRKQVLASNSIFTAADIDEYSIRGIKGFADVLTSHLLVWKENVLRQFRFDPTTAISPTDHRSLTLKYRNRQQHLLAEMGQQIRNLESLAPACRAALQKLIPRLKKAIAVYEQADADLRELHENQ